MPALVFAALLAASAPANTAVVSSLRVTLDSGAEIDLRINAGDGPTGPKDLTADCVRDCKHPLHIRKQVDGYPFGLFQRWDGDNLVYCIWGGGTAYRVQVWAVSDDGLRTVFEQSSRGRPDFLSDSGGRQLIRTFMRPVDARGRDRSQNLEPILWRLENGRYRKLTAHVRDRRPSSRP